VSLEDEIQNRLIADTDSILENNLDRVENLFQFHRDGTIDLHDECRDLAPANQMLVYLIAHRYAEEGGLAEEDTVETEFFYERIDRKERTVREHLQSLRESGLATKEGRSTYRLIVENLPKALDRLESADNVNGETE
jgi:DNA-binding transcriptional ArsR family regulator